MTLDQFLQSKSRNAWVTFKTLDVYVRRGHHHINNTVTGTFDIANVVNAEQFRGAGQFWSLISHLVTTLPPATIILIENVHNTQLAKSLRDRNWTEVDADGLCASFLSLPPNYVPTFFARTPS